LQPFVQSAVAPGATIHTDGWSGYAGLKAAGYPHRMSVVSASPDPAHKVASLLKRWLLGRHHGGIQRQHLTTSTSSPSASTAATRMPRDLLFHRFAEQAVAVGSARYSAIIKAKPRDPARSVKGIPTPHDFIADGVGRRRLSEVIRRYLSSGTECAG
jgi:hypothetical protein